MTSNLSPSEEQPRNTSTVVFVFSGPVENVTTYSETTDSNDHINISNILLELKTFLNQKAKSLQSSHLHKHPLNGQAINVVPLKLTREVFRARRSFSREISEQDNLSHKNLFTEAVKLVEQNTDHWREEAEKENHRIIHGNIVGVIGLPGSGKTTLTTDIAKQCVENNLYNTEFLFYIRFEDISLDKNVTLLNLLLASYSSSFKPSWKNNANVDSAVLDELEKSSNVLIILDGLNEAHLSKLSQYSPPIKLHDTAQPDEFVKNILSGNILPNAKKILTSRPRQMYELYRDYRPHFIACVHGFDTTSQQLICQDMCGDTHEKVCDCILHSPSIKSFCRNPLNCILFVQCLNKLLQESDVVDVLGSVTELFVLALEKFLCVSDIKGDLHGANLYQLGWISISEQRFYFSSSDMEKAGVTSDHLTALFTLDAESEPGKKILDGKKKYSFTHVMLAEFLAAVKLFQTIDSAEFRNGLEFLDKRHFETVTKFLFGLCHEKTMERLSNLGISSNFSNNDIRLQDLKNFAKQTLRTTLEKKQKNSLDVLLRICSCVYEMHDEEFAVDVAQVFGNELIVMGNIYPGDIAGFCYVMRAKRSHAFEINLGPCIKFIGNSFCQFFEKMFDTIRESKIKMTKVDVTRNNIGDDEAKALAKCLPYITSLNISDCKLTDAQVQIITEHIEQSKTFYNIWFSYNSIKDISATYIASCFHYIDQLCVLMCSFSEKGIQTLADAIKSRDRPLKHFCLSGNITTDKLNHLSSCVDKIDDLFIGLQHEKTNVVSGIKQLCSAIENLSQPMKGLTIRGSNIGDEGLKAISKCLKNVIELRLGNAYDENLTLLGIRELSTAFSKLPESSPMLRFTFCCPQIYIDETRIEFDICKNKIKMLEIR